LFFLALKCRRAQVLLGPRAKDQWLWREKKRGGSKTFGRFSSIFSLYHLAKFGRNRFNGAAVYKEQTALNNLFKSGKVGQYLATGYTNVKSTFDSRQGQEFDPQRPLLCGRATVL
jgi:hypothetical protein